MAMKFEITQEVTNHIINEANKIQFDDCLPALIQSILLVEG